MVVAHFIDKVIKILPPPPNNNLPIDMKVTNLITKCFIEYTSLWVPIKLISITEIQKDIQNKNKNNNILLTN